MLAAADLEEGTVPKKLTLSKDLKLPLDAVTQTFAILAMRGVGKTHTASVFAEELSEAGLPFVVLDPTGAWWGLRASADGKGDGYPVTILGGDHGDVPLEEGGGKLIADLVAEKAPPLILDVSGLSKSAMRRFVADFAERLYEKNRNPLHLIIDEADAFAPQKPRPDELRMLGALDEIVRRGRIRGLGCTLVTQRSAVLNKDVLTQTEALIVLRTAHPRDRAPVLEWMKVHATPEQLAAVEESLAKLPKGDAWVMSAGWLDLFARVHIRERRTFNSSATPTPGQVRAAPRRLAPVDLAALQERMKETIERAKAADPALLRKRVAELERELARKPAAAPAPAKTDPKLATLARQLRKAVEQAMKFIVTINAEGFFKAGGDAVDEAAVEKAIKAAVASVKKGVEEKLAARNREIDRLRRDAAQTLAAMKKLADADIPVEVTVAHREPYEVKDAPRAAPAHPRDVGPRGREPGDPLQKGERIVLTAVAQYQEGVTREQLAVLTGYKRSSRDTYLQRVRQLGYIVDGERITATPEGLAALGPDFSPLPTGPELLEHWRRKLPAGELACLEVLVAAYPEPVDRERISEQTEYQRSSRDTYLQRLRSRQLITEPGRGLVRAAEALF